MKYILRTILFCIVFIVLFMLCSPISNLFPGKFERLAYGIIGSLLAFITTYFFLIFDKRNFTDIQLKFETVTVLKFFIGIILGVILMGSISLTSIYFSGARIEINPNSNFVNFVFMNLALVAMALMEELGFRAYPLEVMKGKVGTRLTLVITSILFALYHVAGGWSIQAAFLGPAIFGLIFGITTIASNGIAMSTGMHYAVNLTTSAFANSVNSTSIWILKKSNQVETNHTLSIALSLAVLIIAVFTIEVYMKRKTTANII